ncbi:MAG TPA: zinc-dependent alcohol dehydrogenase family protein [Usitatibacter sp.]|nr:zinc-dependent alcohol dehydrogenase family protein [Usitatibacter sp.]
MRLHRPGEPLRLEEVPMPEPGPGEVLLRVLACGVCRTDLHVVDGELEGGKLPIVPGHEIVGRVVARGPGAGLFSAGERVGVAWLARACGKCAFCRTGRENLCAEARFTGLHRDGGYAEHAVADERYCYPIPDAYGDEEAAPLLCAGFIGYRALRFAGDARRLGIYGFGAAGHIVAQIAAHQGREVYAFTRPGDEAAQRFALQLGCRWAGESTRRAPVPLDAAILFAPVGALVPAALAAVERGGRVVCAGIHMSDIPAFPYALLWGERSVRSVANLTRRDGDELLEAAVRARLHPSTRRYRLDQANAALEDLRRGAIEGAAVLVPAG